VLLIHAKIRRHRLQVTAGRRTLLRERARSSASAGRAPAQALFTGVGTVGYYLAYVWIIGRTLTGALTIAALTFLAGSFRRLRNLLEGLLASFSPTAAEAPYQTICSISSPGWLRTYFHVS
jgi:hypothetical protein